MKKNKKLLICFGVAIIDLIAIVYVLAPEVFMSEQEPGCRDYVQIVEDIINTKNDVIDMVDFRLNEVETLEDLDELSNLIVRFNSSIEEYNSLDLQGCSGEMIPTIALLDEKSLQAKIDKRAEELKTNSIVIPPTRKLPSRSF